MDPPSRVARSRPHAFPKLTYSPPVPREGGAVINHPRGETDWLGAKEERASE